MSEINVFIDWASKKKHIAVIEANSGMDLIKNSTFVIKFASLQELRSELNSIESVIENSRNSINVLLETGVPHLFLHQLISEGYNVFLVDGKLVKELRGDKEKTDEKDAEYIRELYHQNPEVFKPVTLDDKNLVQAKYLVAKYIHFTKSVARLKNQQKAFERQFGETGVYEPLIKNLLQKKKEMIKEVLPLLEEDIQKIKIKGVGDVLSMQILASAHPKNFDSRMSYLAYCGYCSTIGVKYNRLSKTTAYQMSKSCIMHKNEKYYPLYLKLKEDLAERFPEDSKGKINGKAINRLSTFILKEVYQSVKNV